MNTVSVGIDLGTTNTVCCRFDNNIEFIRFRGKELLPSIMYYRDGKVTVGATARKNAIIYPENVIMSAKTFIGNTDKKWNIMDDVFNPTDVAEHLLREVYKEVQKNFKTEHCKAVITVPAYFTSKQYSETEKAAKRAGFEVIQILPEPVAAAIAYGIDENKCQNIFVIDLGGGTFDVSALRIEDKKFETLSVNGDCKLGGDDFDQIIVGLCMQQIRKEFGINLSSQEKSRLEVHTYNQILKKLKFEAEKAKIELSMLDETNIITPSLISGESRSINFSMELTKDKFENACQELLNRIETVIEDCLDEANIDTVEIDKVILVGGSSNIPCVQELVKGIFESDLYANKDLSKLVAMGAAIMAADETGLISEKPIVVINKLAYSLGIEVLGERFSVILPKNTEYPCKKSHVYTTTRDYQEAIMVKVYEGEDEDNVKNNDYHSQYTHTDIELARKGVPKIEVTFEFDKSRVLHISSIDKRTKTKGGMRINIK